MSDDKSKCLANVCVCSNGVASSGEKCASDGGKMCDSCGDGFKLKQDKTACEGRSGVTRAMGSVAGFIHFARVRFFCVNECDNLQFCMYVSPHKHICPRKN